MIMPDESAEQLARSRRRWVLLACLLAIFMSAIEATIVGTAMPAIVAQLGDVALLGWVFSAYLVAQAVAIPFYGRLADVRGRGLAFTSGVLIFLAGSILCGFARSLPQLIAFRILQGLGAGAIMPVAMTIVGDIYKGAERGRVQGALSSVWGIAAVIGPLLGVLIVNTTGWPLVFWLNLPVGVAALALLAMFFHEPSAASTSSTKGSAKGASFVTLLRNPIMIAGNLGSFAIGAAMMGVIVFMPIWVQGVDGAGTTAAAWGLATLSVVWPVASTVAGRLLDRLGNRRIAFAGGTALTLGCALLAFLSAESSLVWLLAGSALTGAGLGMCNTTYVVAVQASASQQTRARATASVSFSRILGSGLGAAALGTILNVSIEHHLPGVTDPVERLMDYSRKATLAPADLAAIASGVSAALHQVFIAASLFGLAAFAVGWLFPRKVQHTR